MSPVARSITIVDPEAEQVEAEVRRVEAEVRRAPRAVDPTGTIEDWWSPTSRPPSASCASTQPTQRLVPLSLVARLRGLVALKRAYERDAERTYGCDDGVVEHEFERGIVAGMQIAIDRLVAETGVEVDDPPPFPTRERRRVERADEESAESQRPAPAPVPHVERRADESRTSVILRACREICATRESGCATTSEILRAIEGERRDYKEERRNAQIIQQLRVTGRLIGVDRGVYKIGRDAYRRGGGSKTAKTSASTRPNTSTKPRSARDPSRVRQAVDDLRRSNRDRARAEPGSSPYAPEPTLDEMQEAASDLGVEPVGREAPDWALADAYQAGNRAAGAILIQKHEGMLRKTCRRYGKRVDLDDLLQEARMGFLRGIMKWRRDGGASPLTYAIFWARNAIGRYAEDNSSDVRVPNRLHNGPYREGREDGVRLFHAVSMEQPLGSDPNSGTLADVMAAPSTALDDDEVANAGRFEYLRAELRRRIDALPERERDVMRRRYLDEQRLREIGRDYDLSRERIRQIEVIAIRRIERAIERERKGQAFVPLRKVHRREVQNTPNKLDAEKVRRIHALAAEGASLREIARVVGVDRETVHVYVGPRDRSAAMVRFHARMKAEGRPVVPPWRRERGESREDDDV